MAPTGPKGLTSFDDLRSASASRELLWTKAFIFLKDAMTDIGTAQGEDKNNFRPYPWYWLETTADQQVLMLEEFKNVHKAQSQSPLYA